MKVLFDYQIFSMQKYGGISRYFANLHNYYKDGNELKSNLGVLFTDNIFIEDQRLPAKIISKFIKKDKRRYKYNKWYGKYLVQQNSFDVFHPTYYHPYFLKSLKKPFVITVHDMIYELFPEYYKNEPYKLYKHQLVKRADHIIAISECTRNDIQKFYNVPDNKITVIHHGCTMQTTKGMLADNTIDDENYILFVGNRFGYKNFDRFIKAAAPLLLKYQVKLICAGGGRFKPEEINEFIKLNIVNKIKQITIDDDQLMRLYKNAIAFVYPSIYEGFGLPVLEAFFNNCPVIMSNTSSMPEVGGNAAEYFNPIDVQSIAFAIEEVISNDFKQKELKLKGIERLKLFSFETCVQKTSGIYRLLV